jgi:hypothetical protein
MKKVLSIVLTIAMVMSFMPSVVFAANTATYSDISGKKCEAAVEELTELGVVDGYPDGTFKPEGEVTRAEMSKLIVAALGMNPTSGTTKFTDMDQAKWAIPFVGYAESLGIVNGYGGGKFGPNDKVTYDQAITMIVRALGYTDNCEEMQGTWPANYVQKGNELGVLKDVNKTGADKATRGDIAIMIANVLDRAMVYIDKDGVTQYKSGKDDAEGFWDGTKVTMRGTLVKDAGSGYYTTSDEDVEDAVNNIREYLGAAGKQVWDKDKNVISVSDIKTEFVTGDFNAAGDKFTADDKDYTFSSSPLKKPDRDTGKAERTREIPYYVNGVWTAMKTKQTTASDGTTTTEHYGITSISDLKGLKDVTLAATIDGKKITGVYSAQTWTISNHAKVETSDLAQISKNHKLLGQKFAETNNGDIDSKSFLLKGADSLDKIEADNVVYVYTGNGTVKKIEVGTEVVTGEITKAKSSTTQTDSYVVIDGKQYNVASKCDANSIANLKAGNEVDLYLDYSGNIYKADKVSADNYAYVIYTSNWGGAATFDSDTKIKLLTENGVESYEVNAGKVTVDNTTLKNADNAGKVWTGLRGKMVKFTLSDGKVKALTTVGTPSREKKITKKGYIDSLQIDENALIFVAPTKATAGPLGFTVDADDDDYSVVKKADVLDSDLTVAVYATNSKGNKIEAMIIDDGLTTVTEYGVVTDSYKIEDDATTGVDYVVNKKAGSAKLEAAPDHGYTLGTALYQIKKAADGSIKVEDLEAAKMVGKDYNISTPADNGQYSDGSLTIGNDVYNLSDEVIIYIWNRADAKLDVEGSTSDLYSDDNKAMHVYKNVKADDDNQGLVTYIIIEQ